MRERKGAALKILFIRREDDAAFLWAYLMAVQGEDLRKGDLHSKRALELRDLACRQTMTKYGRKFEWCLVKYGYLSWSLREIVEEYQVRRKSRHTWGFSSSVVCCESCCTGMSSIPFEEIEEQMVKFEGLYICKSCENAAQQIASAPLGVITTGGGKPALIAKDGVYHDEGMRTPGTSMLGFGGRWYLLFISEEVAPEGFENIKRVDPDTGVQKSYTVNQTRVALTNNLFLDRGLHKKLLPIFAEKVNTRIISVELKQLQSLRRVLGSREWFNEGRDESKKQATYLDEVDRDG